MTAARMLSALVGGLLFLAEVSPAQTGPVLRYVFDKGGAQNDVGAAPGANGSLAGAATFISSSPALFTCGSLDLTGNGANHNYMTTGADVPKIDALPELTVTFWMNLRGAPAEDDCLVSDSPSGYPPAGQGGWEIRTVGGGSAPTASSFRLSFEVLQSFGGWNGYQGQMSPPINADHRWVFVAVTYTSWLLQRYYIGDEATPVEQIGTDSYFSYPLLDNTAELRVGSANTEPTIDRTPPAWIDDLRIYSRALSDRELDEVREENLHQLDSGAVPGFIPLGGVPGTACNMYAQAISADGSTVVGQAFASGVQLGYRWRNGSRELLADLPGADTNGNALRTSADGSIVVGWGQSVAGTYEAVRWDEAGACTSLGDFPGGELFSTAYGVSSDGSVIIGVGVDRSGYLADAFRYAGGVMEKLGYLPGGTQSAAYDVSQDGTVIVGVSDSAEGAQAFRWQSGSFMPLGDLAGGTFESRANKVAAGHGVVVGWGQSAFGREAAAWGGTRAFGLGDLPGGAFSSEAYGVSAFGSYIVGKGRATGPTSYGLDEAFIWDRANGMRPLKSVLETDYGLDLTGWRFAAAVGISDDGSTLTAYGVNPAGLGDSILVRLPVPGAIMDFDFDEDVDLDDFEIFTHCATGPGIPYDPAALPPGCTLNADVLGLIAPDLDWDGDIDQADFALLQRCLGASGDAPPPSCRG